MSDFLVFSCYRAKILSAEYCHLCEAMLHTPYSSHHLPPVNGGEDNVFGPTCASTEAVDIADV